MKSARFRIRLPEGETIRLDQYIATLGLFSRSQISRHSVVASDGHGTLLKLSRRLQDGEMLHLEWEDLPPSRILPESMNLNILYENEDCAVIDKPQGIVVHPAIGHMNGTLLQGLLHRYAGLESRFDGECIRPGIVHRLDKDTSGLIIIAKHQPALDFLAEEFRQRRVKKVYLAIIRGKLPTSEGEITRPIGRDPRNRKRFKVGTRNAKEAHTYYRVLSRCGDYSLIKVRILTGRTHQIRVHLKSMNTPVLGDPIYGRADSLLPDASLMLHAWKLSLTLPSNVKRRFASDIPLRFFQTAETLGLDIEK